MDRLVGRRVVFVVVVVALASSGNAVGQQKSRPSWKDLSPQQQGEVREHYERFQQLPERDRQSVEQMYRRWQDLPPTQQQQLRKNYERYLNLEPAQRQKFDSEYRRWKSHQGGGGNADTR